MRPFLLCCAADCTQTLTGINRWRRICENVTKDGPQSYAGELTPIPNRPNAYWGKVEGTNNGFGMRLMVVNSNGTMIVGVTEYDDIGWTQLYKLITFDSTPNNVTQNLSDPLLTENAWTSDIGATFEIDFAATSSGFAGTGLLFFGANPNGYCPTEAGLVRLCETAQKNGPVPLTFNFTRRNVPGFVLDGTLSSSVFNGNFIQDLPIMVSMGHSLPNPNIGNRDSLYIRFLGDPHFSGIGVLAQWHELAPMTGPMHKPDGNISTLNNGANRDPDAPNGGEICEIFSNILAQISDPDEENHAYQLLAQNGFFGGMVPDNDEIECARAADILTNNHISGFADPNQNEQNNQTQNASSNGATYNGLWPAPGQGFAIDGTGPDINIELATTADGNPLLLIHTLNRCHHNMSVALCQALQFHIGDDTRQIMNYVDNGRIGMGTVFLDGIQWLVQIVQRANGQQDVTFYELQAQGWTSTLGTR